MGKCANCSPTCEWEARFYDLDNSSNRPSRISAYVFQPVRRVRERCVLAAVAKRNQGNGLVPTW
jgi:hypothetical protein